jgi:Mg-chelatase subunit ChlD
MRTIFWSLIVGSIAAIGACSGANTSSTFHNSGGTSSNSGGSSSQGGSTSSGGTQGAGGTISLTGGAGGGGGSLSPDAACASSQQQAAGIPVDIYAMIDISGSMDQQNKWTSVKQALSTFVNDTANKGIGIGIQYFPASNECALGSYSTPSVPIAALPNNAQAIITSLNQHSPGGGTPTQPALEGAIQYARTWKTQNPTHTVIVLLATDGEPNDCNSSVHSVESVASAGASGNPQIPTFVIGVGSSLTSLNGIAAAGGSKQAYIVTSGDVSQFTAALTAIRGAATLPCTYQMPSPPAGQTLDPTKVNVKFTSSGGQDTDLLQVANAGACTTAGGWYYDSSGGTQVIKLCPASCNTVTNDPKGQVNVLLGCKTNIAPPS